MKGKIKWFSQEKGFGFIVDEQGQDLFFGVRDIIGAELPSNLDQVEFEFRQGKKGPAATKISIISKSKMVQNSNHSGKVDCYSCNKNVYPRMVTRYGRPDRSFCPICGAELKDFLSTGMRIFRGILNMLRR